MNQTQLENRFQQAIWCQAVASQPRSLVDFYRVLVWRIIWDWPSLTIITITVIGSAGTTFYGVLWSATVLPWGGIILGAGLLLEAGLLWTGLHDETRRSGVRLSLLPAELAVRLDVVKNRRLRVKVLKGLQIWGHLDDLTQSVARPIWRNQVMTTQERIQVWLQAIFVLACRLDQAQVTMAHHRKSRALSSVVADDIRQEVNLVEQQLDQTLQTMAALYAEVLVVVNRGQLGRDLTPLQVEIGSEIERLQDLAEAVQETL